MRQHLLNCIYLSPSDPLRVSAFFEEVASHTGVGVQLQHLLYLGHDLPLEGSMKVVNLPSTSPTQPLILLSYGLEANNSLPFRERKATRRHEQLLMCFCEALSWSLFYSLLSEDVRLDTRLILVLHGCAFVNRLFSLMLIPDIQR